MTADQANQFCAQIDRLGWDYTHEIRSGDHRVTLGLVKMDGGQLLQLFALLAPAGTPIAGVTVALEQNRGLVID